MENTAQAQPKKSEAAPPPAKKEPQVTPVLVNRESMVHIQLKGKTNAKGVHQHGPLMILLPGMNFVETEKWEQAKENEVVLSMLTDPILPSRSPEQNPERVGHPILEERAPVSKDNPLAALSEKDAVVMVGEVFDVATLNKLADQETRPQVGAALKSQIGKITKPKADGKKKSS
jgi:hypothetical protein